MIRTTVEIFIPAQKQSGHSVFPGTYSLILQFNHCGKNSTKNLPDTHDSTGKLTK